MRKVLKGYLIIGVIVFFIMSIMNFITPAISDMALTLNSVDEWIGHVYTVESVVFAYGIMALIEKQEKQK